MSVCFNFFLIFIISYYNRQWADAQVAISDLLQQEIPAEPPKPEKVYMYMHSNFLMYINFVHLIFTSSQMIKANS